MKLKLSQILDSKTILSRLGAVKMGASTAYKVQRNISKINSEIEEFEKMLKHLNEQIGEKTEQGIYIPENKKEEYVKEVTELLSEEIEIDISMVKIEDLNCEITPFELMQIDWMLKEE